MTAILERTAIDTRREELNTRLASAQSRLRDAKFKASMDDAFLPDMIEAENLVRHLEQQIEGLQDAGSKVNEQEAAAAEAERLAERRAAAVDILRFLPERDAIAAKAREALDHLSDALADIQKANSKLAAMIPAHCVSENGAELGTLFVKLSPAADHHALDRAREHLEAVLRTGGEGADHNGTHPPFRSHALAVIAGVLPEMRDVDVQAESGAAIDPAFLPN